MHETAEAAPETCQQVTAGIDASVVSATSPAVNITVPAWTSSDACTPAPQDPQVHAEYLWIQQERARLENYFANSFRDLKQSHGSFLQDYYRFEEQRLRWHQDVNRERALSEAAATKVKQQEADLVLRAEELDARETALSGAQEQVARLQVVAEQLEVSTTRQREKLEELSRAQANAEKELQAVIERAEMIGDDLTHREEEVRLQQEQIAQRRQQLDQRHAECEKAEQALRSRMQEWEEIESRAQEERTLADDERALIDLALPALRDNPELQKLVSGWNAVPECARQTILMLLASR